MIFRVVDITFSENRLDYKTQLNDNHCSNAAT